MPRAPKTPRTQVLALARPTAPALAGEWVLAAFVAAALLLALVS